MFWTQETLRVDNFISNCELLPKGFKIDINDFVEENITRGGNTTRVVLKSYHDDAQDTPILLVDVNVFEPILAQLAAAVDKSPFKDVLAIDQVYYKGMQLCGEDTCIRLKIEVNAVLLGLGGITTQA